MEKNLEIEISKTNRGKEQIILNRKYKFNLSSKRKDNSKKYKCTEYKTLNQCPSFIILNNENQILEYDDSHNHLENKFGAAKSIVKNKIKDEISKSSIPFNVNIKRTYDEISQGMGLICPGYNSIKSQVTRSRRKQLPPDITTFDEIPNESKYYKTKSKIKSECQEHNYVQFLEFLGYFKKTYLINFETENWNYYGNIEHITNNVSETFNKNLKKLFAKKPTFFQLLSELQKEESKYYIDDERRTAGILRNKKQKKLIRTEEIKALVKYYKNMGILLKKKRKVLEMISLNYG
ncbi:hypothetical protein LY90DRAFT_507331 [Neocallimastix californiae]|uniref:FLYWCH-type domain-containing protein n=1 Tax=Neocallimastix californiae TaxID=1754190 RepID=A0A1Y2D6H9_9FUNG|nr:hypothetical protein LY90DRAFT_507331 [Neocallimastix californiae]|eukprot:ORY54911.1 hypothetical protein LY90DRAFT_507331 [Neocallimastix californiae]